MKVLNLISALVVFVIQFLPGLVGDNLRYKYYKKRLKKLGNNVKIGQGVIITNPEYVSIGHNSWIDQNVTILSGPFNAGDREIITKKNAKFTLGFGEVAIGENCHIAPSVFMSGLCGIEIHNKCNIANSTKLYSFTHHYRSSSNPSKIVTFGSQVPQDQQCLVAGPIVIQDNVGIATDCFIGPGITIGEDSFLKIGSVLFNTIKPNKVVYGNPARAREDRFLKK